MLLSRSDGCGVALTWIAFVQIQVVIFLSRTPAPQQNLRLNMETHTTRMRLHIDILEEILDHVCHEFTRDVVVMPDGTYVHRTPGPYAHLVRRHSVHALLDLCLTSKQWYPLAVRRLYRNIRDFSHLKRFSRLAHTLLRRKDLAGIVKHLAVQYSRSWHMDEHVEPEVVAYYQQQSKTMGSNYQIDLEAPRPEKAARLQAINIAVLVSLCQNLESVDCATYEPWVTAALCKPGSLVSLRSIYVYHVGGDGMSGARIETLSRLFAAAPNLKSINLVDFYAHLLDEEMIRPLEHVACLRLVNCFVPQHDFNMLKLCPNLRRLRYSPCGWPDFPILVNTVIKHTSNKLQHFHYHPVNYQLDKKDGFQSAVLRLEERGVEFEWGNGREKDTSPYVSGIKGGC